MFINQVTYPESTKEEVAERVKAYNLDGQTWLKKNRRRRSGPYHQGGRGGYYNNYNNYNNYRGGGGNNYKSYNNYRYSELSPVTSDGTHIF